MSGKGAKCYWCGRTLLDSSTDSPLAASRDHVYPKCKGGTKTVWTCRTCNQLKNDMMPCQWDEYMLNHPRWWEFPRQRKIKG